MSNPVQTVHVLTPGSEEWRNRKDELLAVERPKPLGLWYISFADRDRGGFLGAVIVRAQGPVTAIQRSHDLGINPGGQAMAYEIPPAAPELPSGFMDRLLSRQDLEQGLGPVEELA